MRVLWIRCNAYCVISLGLIVTALKGFGWLRPGNVQVGIICELQSLRWSQSPCAVLLGSRKFACRDLDPDLPQPASSQGKVISKRIFKSVSASVRCPCEGKTCFHITRYDFVACDKFTTGPRHESTVRKKMAAVHFTTVPCEPNTALQAQRKPNFYNIRPYTPLRKLYSLGLKIL